MCNCFKDMQITLASQSPFMYLMGKPKLWKQSRTESKPERHALEKSSVHKTGMCCGKYNAFATEGIASDRCAEDQVRRGAYKALSS